jgi:anti-sigma regulatory factor (Ser/Thr protein kinase)
MFSAPAAVPGPAAVSTQCSGPLWPLCSFLELGAFDSAVPCARGHVRAIAGEWGLEELADIAELLASEMVTNAVHASERLRTSELPVIRLGVISDRISIVIRVWDSNKEMPMLRDAAPDDESGRGLEIIDTLAVDWDAYRQGNGKVVWALISP